MKIKAFPRVMFISIEAESSGDEWISASLTKDAALGDDHRKRVGLYKLVEVQEIAAMSPASRKVRSCSTKVGRDAS